MFFKQLESCTDCACDSLSVYDGENYADRVATLCGKNNYFIGSWYERIFF